MKYKTIGDSMQDVAVELAAGETIFGKFGSMLFARGAIKSETAPQEPYWDNLSRILITKNEPPLVVFRCGSGSGLVAFRTPSPGRIHVVNMDGSGRLIIRRKMLIAATEGIQFEPLFLQDEDTGSVPQQLFVTSSGSGLMFLHGPGNLIEFNLSSGDCIVVDGMMILCMDGQIDYSPHPVHMPSEPNPLEEMMIMHITGPGRLVLFTHKYF